MENSKPCERLHLDELTDDPQFADHREFMKRNPDLLCLVRAVRLPVPAVQMLELSPPTIWVKKLDPLLVGEERSKQIFELTRAKDRLLDKNPQPTTELFEVASALLVNVSQAMAEASGR